MTAFIQVGNTLVNLAQVTAIEERADGASLHTRVWFLLPEGRMIRGPRSTLEDFAALLRSKGGVVL
jgi:hypothetical protein